MKNSLKTLLRTIKESKSRRSLLNDMRLLTGKGRWAILLALLDGPANLKTIAERAGMTSTASCHQIKKLKRGGVAVSREEGREVFYSLAE